MSRNYEVGEKYTISKGCAFYNEEGDLIDFEKGEEVLINDII